MGRCSCRVVATLLHRPLSRAPLVQQPLQHFDWKDSFWLKPPWNHNEWKCKSIMSMHFIRLESDQCLSCSSLNPFFCSRSWSFYFCCLEVWNTFKTCWQSRSLQRFLQRVPSCFPLHCLLLDRPANRDFTWYNISYRIVFSMSESYMTLTLKIWSHLFRGQGGSRRGGWYDC